MPSLSLPSPRAVARALRAASLAGMLALGCGGPSAGSEDAGASLAASSLDEEATEREAIAAPVPEARLPEATRRPYHPPVAGEEIPISAGTLRVGSLPGTAGRRPSVEADLVPMEIPPFSIDRLPFPNDPELPPILVASRDEASRMCAARGQRLCHELEWERACKGDGAASFPSGERFEPSLCQDDDGNCASPLSVLRLGTAHAEWVSNDADERLARYERTAVVRGASAEGDLSAHRCGARNAVLPVEPHPFAFRCCRGEASELSYPDVGLRRQFTPLTLERDRAREILRSVPELATYAEAFVSIGESDADRALSAGGTSRDRVPWEFASSALSWSPSPGEEIWVFAGQSGENTLVAALYPLPGGTFRHAGSFIIRGEALPLALAYSRGSRQELLFSTAWGNPGEGGAITFGEDARITLPLR